MKLQRPKRLPGAVQEVVRRHDLIHDHVAVLGIHGHLIDDIVAEGGKCERARCRPHARSDVNFSQASADPISLGAQGQRGGRCPVVTNFAKSAA